MEEKKEIQNRINEYELNKQIYLYALKLAVVKEDLDSELIDKIIEKISLENYLIKTDKEKLDKVSNIKTAKFDSTNVGATNSTLYTALNKLFGDK